MLFNLLFFLGLFLVAFLVFLIMNLRRLKKKKQRKMKEVNYLISRFKLDKKKINYKALAVIISIANGFIISFVCTVICILPCKLIWQMLIGFVMLFVLIFLFYELIGRMCIKKGWKENVRSKRVKSSKNR